jgi:hypothetical protein
MRQPRDSRGRHLTMDVSTANLRIAMVFIFSCEWKDEMKREAGANPALPRSGMWKRPSPDALGPGPGSGGQ